MRQRPRVDANHPEIAKGLRKVPGVSVTSIAALKGVGDLLVGRANRNYILEVKDPSQPPSKRRLTEDEAAFKAGWHGQHAVVHSLEEALDVIGVRP